VVEMTHSSTVSSLGSEFDDFLFAPVGEERNGMLLSVLSALARLDIDPWQEAAKLADLPGETATQRLTSLIAALPDEPSAHRDSGRVATRLIALLPSRSRSDIPSRETSLGAGALPKSWPVLYVITYAIFMMALWGGQYVIANRQPPTKIDNARASASSMVSSQAPMADSGQ
jgi:hypothetical protein